MDAKPLIEAFLRQSDGQWTPIDETLERLHEIVG